MDEQIKKELRSNTVTIGISAVAFTMGVVAVIIAAVNGGFSWVGIIVAVAMAVNAIAAYRRRKEILEYAKNNPK